MCCKCCAASRHLLLSERISILFQRSEEALKPHNSPLDYIYLSDKVYLFWYQFLSHLTIEGFIYTLLLLLL